MTFEDELLALERRVLEGAGGDFFAAVAALRRMLAMESPGVEAAILKLAVPQLQAAAVSGVGEAWSLGGGRALDSAMLGGLDANAIGDASELRVKPGPPKHLSDPLDGLDGLLSDAKTKASALLRSGAGVDTALAPIFNAATTARLRVTTQINAASNQAALEVGDATSSPMVWEAERDACVYCLALAGEVVETPGQTFPKADLYADPPPSQWTVERPPLHGHCRCRLAILVEPSYADALKREAQRSILRGTSLSSESNAVRIRAASRLLDRDPIAPKSVKEYARKAVKAGTFPKGREVPTGDPRLIITRGGGEPPKVEVPEPPKPPNIADRIRSATSTLEVADALREHLGKTELIGWTDQTTVTAARQIATTVAGLVDKYPKVNLEQVRIEPMKAGMLAYASERFEGHARQGVSIAVNSKHLGDDDARAAFVQPSISHGFFHQHDAKESLVYTLTHEFGHTVDYTSDKKTRRQIASIQTRYAKESGIPKTSPLWHLNLSGYARVNSGEAIAEAFADVEINGDKAKGLSRAIYAALVKNLEEA